MRSIVLPIGIASSPPMNQSTPMKVIAEMTAEKTPMREVDRGVDAQTQILGHAIFRVAVIARNQVELIVTSAGEPLIEHVRVQPGAPPALQGHFRIGRRCGHDDHAREDQGEEDHRLVQHAAAVAVVERVEHGAVPDVQPVLKAEIHQRNR